MVRAFVPALLALSPALASAQLLGQLGDVALNRVGDVPPGVSRVLDAQGNAYSAPGDGVECHGSLGSSVYYLVQAQGIRGRFFGLPDPGGRGILTLVFDDGSTGGPPRISLYRVECRVGATLLGQLDLNAGSRPARGVDLYGVFGFLSALDASGRFCQPSSDGLYCFSEGTPLVAELVLDAQALANQLLGGRALSAVFPSLSARATIVGQRIGPMVFDQDGTLYALFNLDLSDQGASHLAITLVQRTQSGAVILRHGPELSRRSGGYDYTDYIKALATASALAIDRASSTLLVFPRHGRRLLYAPWAMHVIRESLGAATFPLAPSNRAHDGPGHIELSQVFEQTLGNPGNPTMVQMETTAAGKVRFLHDSGIFELSFDPDGVDMDEDGLSSSEERALGTSDYAEDSDGGGVRDPLELKLYQTNPLAAADDRLRRHTSDIEYAYSPLIRERLDRPIERGYWPSNYLCGGGACYDRAGAAVVTGLGFYGPITTDDPNVVVARVGDEIKRVTLPAGSAEVVARVADVTALIPSGGSVELVAGKGRALYSVADRRVVAFGDGTVRVVFDLDMEQCRSKLGSCAPPYVDTTLYPIDAYTNLLLAGYDPVIDRLLVVARGNMDSALIGVAPGVPAVVLARGAHFPTFLLGTGQGDLPSAVIPDAFTPTADGDLWSSYEGAAGYTDGDYRAYDSTNAAHLSNYPGRGWDDSLFVSSAGGPTPQGLFELERLDGTLQPGDVAMFAGPNSVGPGDFLPSRSPQGPYLYRVGRRGGVGPLFDRVGEPGTFSELGAVRGMAVSSDGRICAAGLDGRLHELSQPDPRTHVPTRVDTYTRIMGAADCLYDPEGKIHVLIESPPGVLIFDPRSATDGTLYAITGMSVPTRFVRVGDGKYRIADAAGPMQCADIVAETLTPSGLSIAGLTVARSGELFLVKRPEGTILRANVDAVCAGAATPLEFDAAKLYMAAARPVFPWIVANIAERPDGRLAVMPARSRLAPYDVSVPIQEPTYLFFLDPADKSFQISPLDFDLAGIGSAMALVPGATWSDPWTEGSVTPRPDGGAVVPPARDAGTSGGGGDDDGGGCSARPASSGEVLLIALMLLLRRRRAQVGPGAERR